MGKLHFSKRKKLPKYSVLSIRVTQRLNYGYVEIQKPFLGRNLELLHPNFSEPEGFLTAPFF